MSAPATADDDGVAATGGDDGVAATGGDDGARYRPVDRAAMRGERSTPPRADGLPVVGKVLELIRDPHGFYEALGYGYDADAVAYRVNRTPAVMLTHPEYVQQVLVEDAPNYRKGQVVSRAFEGFGEQGLVASEGEEWARDRALVQPAFYRERVETYADAMVEEAERAADEWAGAESVRVDAATKEVTLRIIARTMFGADLSGRGAVIRDAADAILARVEPTNPSAYLPVWVPTPSNRRFLRAMDGLKDAMSEMVAERRATDDADQRGDLLSMLVDAEYDDGSTMSRERLQDHLVTFVFAGHETTALLLTWALWSLATNPDAQDRLQRELDDALADAPEGRPTADVVADLPYLDAVVDETTRRYPPAYNLFREATTDVEVGPFEVPEGTTVTTPQWVVHRDPRWYDDPESFDPDRWTPEMRESLPEYAHFPFGGGPRSCIGNRFATLEAKLILATLLARFDVTPKTEAVGVEFTATLQPDRPVHLYFTERSD